MANICCNYITIQGEPEILDILYKMLEEYQWTIDDISYYVSLVTDGAYTNFKKMPPEYIDDLLMAIKEDA